jgi:hypothetical protein
MAPVALVGCEPSVDRGQRPVQQAAPASNQQSDQGYQIGHSQSALGKARDSAHRVKDKTAAYNKKIEEAAEKVNEDQKGGEPAKREDE